ncbi:hypothetical protein [Deinococcus humi]|uniref:Uncharacterized protein n=1 Tax=Deinococcus humi TaxID=662880 RepID=A0A7W8JV51_9DEIO|nr:hypothetical protein [Deinococcus humi]MBB5363832.1 hypothetical protein [Deinococcus humi]
MSDVHSAVDLDAGLELTLIPVYPNVLGETAMLTVQPLKSPVESTKIPLGLYRVTPVQTFNGERQRMLISTSHQPEPVLAAAVGFCFLNRGDKLMELRLLNP